MTGPQAPVALPGGVSAVVVAQGDLVVKRARRRLDLAATVLADPRRVANEAAALRLATALPVPAVRAVDPAAGCLVVDRLPGRPWKPELLAGRVDPEVGRRLGMVLRRLRAIPVPEGALDPSVFDQLRLGPYHRALARRHPDLAPRLLSLADALADSRGGLVHGDATPKNVLVDGSRGEPAVHLVDFETAHVGDPSFDGGLLCAHLVLKAARRPDLASAYGRTADAFWEAWDPADPAGAGAHLATALLARVDGLSPVEYLEPAAVTAVRAAARRLLRSGADHPDAAFAAVLDERGPLPG